LTERITQAAWRATQRRKPRVDREHQEQKALITWAKFESGRIPELALLFAIPNGGHRNKATAGKLKAEGVKAGVPDLCLPVACGKYHGLFIELKAPKGRVTDDQREWLAALDKQNYGAVVCFGWEHAKTVIETYLRYGPPLGEGVK